MTPRSIALRTLLLLVAAPLAAPADEGMWMLHQVASLDQASLKASGLALSPQAIWDPATGTGLAAAVVSLGGCTASFVSPDGLIATNHHCAFRAIQTNATVEHDTITEGFLAAGRAGELPARGYHVYVFAGYDDVSVAMHGALRAGMTAEQRSAALEAKEKELVAGCERSGLRCRVVEMFGGLDYYLFRSLDLRDVRLAYAPPRAIGEYGGEVDNWVWPRHTGDFSFLRAYVGPDGRPADYSPANVPYHPRCWLRLASRPLRAGDLTVLMGYPGRTMRYRLSTAVDDDTEFAYPARVSLYAAWISLLEAESARGKQNEIALASTIKRYANTLKNGQGMLDGLRRLEVAEQKRAQEDALAAWVAAEPARRLAWGDVLPRMNELLAGRRATRERDFLLGLLDRGPALLNAAVTVQRWAEERAKPDAGREPGFQDRDVTVARQRLALLQNSLVVAADKALMADLLRRAESLPARERITTFDAALAATGKNGEAAIAALVDRLYAGTRLADESHRMEMFGMDSATLARQHDAFVDLATTLRAETRTVDEAKKRFEGEMVALEPRYIEALRAYRKEPLYPDANSTLRFNLGTVAGYSPRDAVDYAPFTTLRGVVEKHTGVEPFNCPQALLDAFNAGRRGPYVDEALRDVPACFLTTNDSTGGNSGSPLMNGRGELVGLLFDGNIESMTSDYAVDPAITRSIGVDVRYMLWVMDYVSHARELMREMGVEPDSK